MENKIDDVKTDKSSSAVIENESGAGESRKTDESKPYYVKLQKPFEYGKKTYTGFDLTGASTLTTEQKIDIDRIYEEKEFKKPRNPILSTMYAVCVAQYVTKEPFEVFLKMRNSEFLKIETAVKSAFFMPI